MAQEGDSLGVLRTLLQNPAMMQGLLSLAGSLLAEEDNGQNKDATQRRALLLAVKPYLGQERQTHLDTLLQILQIVDHLNPTNLSALLGKEEEGDEASGNDTAV